MRRIYIGELVSRFLPKTRQSDHLVAFFRFLWFQRRLPDRKRMWFNDYLYRVKVSGMLSDPLRRLTTDKEYLKSYVRWVLGDEFNIPTIAVFRTLEEASLAEYPANSVVKPTHMSGSVFFTGPEALQPPLQLIRRWLRSDFYSSSREINYKELPRKVIVEPLIFGVRAPEDYKIFCWNGVARMCQVDLGRFDDHRRILFDREGASLPFTIRYAAATHVPVPRNYKRLLEVAEALAKPFGGLVRIDLYSDNEKIYCGEITHCHGSASERFVPISAESRASEIIFGEGLF